MTGCGSYWEQEGGKGHTCWAEKGLAVQEDAPPWDTGSGVRGMFKCTTNTEHAFHSHTEEETKELSSFPTSACKQRQTTNETNTLSDRARNHRRSHGRIRSQAGPERGRDVWGVARPATPPVLSPQLGIGPIL